MTEICLTECEHGHAEVKLIATYFFDHFTQLRQIFDQKQVLSSLDDVLARQVTLYTDDNLTCYRNPASDISMYRYWGDFSLVISHHAASCLEKQVCLDAVI